MLKQFEEKYISEKYKKRAILFYCFLFYPLLNFYFIIIPIMILFKLNFTTFLIIMSPAVAIIFSPIFIWIVIRIKGLLKLPRGSIITCQGILQTAADKQRLKLYYKIDEHRFHIPDYCFKLGLVKTGQHIKVRYWKPDLFAPYKFKSFAIEINGRFNLNKDIQLGAHKLKSKYLIIGLAIFTIILSITTVLFLFVPGPEEWLDFRAYVASLLLYNHKEPIMYQSVGAFSESPPPIGRKFILKPVYIWPTTDKENMAYVLNSPLPSETMAKLKTLTEKMSARKKHREGLYTTELSALQLEESWQAYDIFTDNPDFNKLKDYILHSRLTKKWQDFAIDDLHLLKLDDHDRFTKNIVLTWLAFAKTERQKVATLFQDWLVRTKIDSILTYQKYTDWERLTASDVLTLLKEPSKISGMAVYIKQREQGGHHLERLYIRGAVIVFFYVWTIFTAADIFLLMYILFIGLRNRIILSRLSSR